jgi:hypothetical protein
MRLVYRLLTVFEGETLGIAEIVVIMFHIFRYVIIPRRIIRNLALPVVGCFVRLLEPLLNAHVASGVAST